MDALRALVLGIIEGLTEFLPVSSTGHLVIAMPVLGVSPHDPTWEALLWISQLAAILAVVVFTWRDLWRRTFRPASRNWQDHIVAKLGVAMIPTVILALALKKALDPLEEMPWAVAIALILGAGVMEWIDRRYRRAGEMEIEQITLRQAFLIGTIQAVSMIPGVSRAGATIMGGMALGLTPRVATEFSFYLAIPTMLAATVFTLRKHMTHLRPENAAIILIGSAAAFLVALVVVAVFLQFVKRHRFTVFAAYRVVLGGAVLAWYLLGKGE